MPLGLYAYDAHHPDPMSFLNGTHTVRHIAKPQEDNATKIQKWRMYKMHKEGKYVLRDEPYSLASKKADPELLGPQRTLQPSAAAPSPSPTPAPTPPAAPVSAPAIAMTPADCVTLIGQEKYDQYVKKYGGEPGALHRCLVLKRLQEH